MNKFRNVLFTASVSLMALFACNSQNQSFQQAKMENNMDSVSYSIGVQLGKSYSDDLQSRGLDSMINKDLITQGLNDFFNGEEKIDPREAYVQINQFFMAQNDQMKQKMAEQADKNLQIGEKFLEENSAKEGVVTLESGLQYKVITEGTGIKPKPTDKVKVHYHGTLISGKVFDSSVDRGEPAEFQLNQVIKGWTEGLQYMTEGSKYVFYIPSDLAYGDRGAGGFIGPNETLVFEVELIEIIK